MSDETQERQRSDRDVSTPTAASSASHAPDKSALDASLVRSGTDVQAVANPGADRPYRVLVERMLDAALIVSADGRVLYQNASTFELLGRRCSGQPFADVFVDEDRQRLGSTLLSSGGVAEGRFRHADGCAVPVSVSISVMEVDGVRRHAVLLHDLRERERCEASEAASAAKSDFLGMLGHEIRNPLASLSATLELLDGAPDGAPGGMSRQTAHTIMRRQLRHIEALVGDLLDTARIERGKLAVALEPLELAPLLAVSLESARLAAADSGVEIVAKIADEPLRVIGDPVRLRQVFENLMRNAVEASEGRGIVEIRAYPLDHATLLVEIADQGRGIAAEELERVFELFVQGGQDEQRPRGLGIGLALVRGLLDALDGALSVHSDGPGCGATFTVRLPRLGSLPSAPSSVPATSLLAASCKSAGIDAAPRVLRILLAEDHRDTREVLRALLSRVGHVVEIADSAAAARRIVGKGTEPFDVLLTDLHLPDQNGLELGRSLRASGEFTGALVALTGRTDAATIERLKHGGFAAHLAKPVSLATLLECLARVTAR